MYIAADFQLDGITEGGRLEESIFQGVSQEMLRQMDACPEIAAAGAVYFSGAGQYIDQLVQKETGWLNRIFGAEYAGAGKRSWRFWKRWG